MNLSTTVFGLVFMAGLLAAPQAAAQAGDRQGETQSDVPADWLNFSSPALSPEQSLETITVEQGFRVELVASEPLVNDPVAMAWDAQGRLFVVEMRGFMPNVDGENELDPIGQIVMLEDMNGDGRMDRSTVFADRLVLPRAITCAFGGVLFIEPPDLIFARDDDGDGVADYFLHLLTGFGGLDSPEHAGNGLVYGLDNWIELSQHPLRLKFDGQTLSTQPAPGHGQWGLARDDVGRFFYTTNSDPLRVDRVPKHYGARNSNAGGLIGVNERIVTDLRVWPNHLTPGINRGYQPGMLAEGRLTKYTAACGTTIYRGDLFPQAYRGNAFICEPSGNLVKRIVIEETGTRIVGSAAYEGREFLASTDERFRPVNAYTGPDGALYIVDLYRGVIQHRMFVTSFLRKQIEARQLDKPLGLGRIYRIVPDTRSTLNPIQLSGFSNTELVDALGHDNGWVRDHAQRLLVERQVGDVTDQLRSAARSDTVVATRLHAFWTLAGVNRLTLEDAIEACSSQQFELRLAGIRAMEIWLDDDPRAIAELKKLSGDDDTRIRVQTALSLGESQRVEAVDVLLDLYAANAGDRELRSAVASGLRGRELAFVGRLLERADWADDATDRREALRVLCDVALRSRDERDTRGYFETISSVPANRRWQSEVMLQRAAAWMRIDSNNIRVVRLARPPGGWEQLVDEYRANDSGGVASEIDEHIDWPGRRSGVALGPRPLSELEQKMFKNGERLFTATCATCHEQSGTGQAGRAPTLVESDYVLGSNDRLVRVLLHGLTGLIEVDGQSFNSDMPKATFGTDAQIASMLTYIRRSWGNEGEPVSVDEVRRVRAEAGDRTQPWTVEELREFE